MVGLSDDARRAHECYASQSEEEYFAQLSNAYLGTNMGSDATTGQARRNGHQWIKDNEPKEMLALLDRLYQHRTVNDITKGGALKMVATARTRRSRRRPHPPGARRREAVNEREVRHFAVYAAGGRRWWARQGTRSTAGQAPGPCGPPRSPGEDPGLPPGVHPFIDAQARDAVSEGRLRALLDESSDFDDYLARLLDAGFDIASWQPEDPASDLPGGARLHERRGRARRRRLAATRPVHEPAPPARGGRAGIRRRDADRLRRGLGAAPARRARRRR